MLRIVPVIDVISFQGLNSWIALILTEGFRRFHIRVDCWHAMNNLWQALSNFFLVCMGEIPQEICKFCSHWVRPIFGYWKILICTLLHILGTYLSYQRTNKSPEYIPEIKCIWTVPILSAILVVNAIITFPFYTGFFFPFPKGPTYC